MSDSPPRVVIRLKEPVRLPRLPGYLKKKRFLSERDREMTAYLDGAPLFDTLVPRTVFNPCSEPPEVRSVATHLMELVLTGAFEVKGKRVVDLGCGCGVIGLSAILAGAASVLFSDINPNIAPLGGHPLLRNQDRVIVQDLLQEEPDGWADLIIFSLPAVNMREDADEIAPASYLTGLLGSEELSLRAIAESARVLAPGGRLVMSVGFSLETIMPYHNLIMALHRAFDLGSMEVLDSSARQHPFSTVLRWLWRTYMVTEAKVSPDRRGRIAFAITKRRD